MIYKELMKLDFTVYIFGTVIWCRGIKGHSGFPYFGSNLVKLDELGKIYNDSVNTLQGYFGEFS